MATPIQPIKRNRESLINGVRNNWTLLATLVTAAITYGADNQRLKQMTDRLDAIEATKPEVMRVEIDRINSDAVAMRGDVSGIRTDVAHTREDVSYIRGVIEHNKGGVR